MPEFSDFNLKKVLLKTGELGDVYLDNKLGWCLAWHEAHNEHGYDVDKAKLKQLKSVEEIEKVI